jgi:hypothetical protein
MPSFSDLFVEEYNTQRNQWENSLKQELKLDDISAKTIRPHLDLGPWPTLSTAAEAIQLPVSSPWKKASQTYFRSQHLLTQLSSDLEAGVRLIFLPHDLRAADWEEAQRIISHHPDVKDIEVVSFTKVQTKSKAFKLIDESQFLHARELHDQGCHNVQELGVLVLGMVENLSTPPDYLGVCLDSHFFKNIAKIRALRLLIAKVSESAGISMSKIIALNSYREWTLFERYSNILRNNVQVASAYIAGADLVQSSGYQAIFELEAASEDEHTERSYRMGRNTTHILALESMLGMVNDAASGSFHLDSLTQRYAQEAWSLMQKLLPLKKPERSQWLENEIKKVREQRLERVHTRKDILAGMNDFPDSREKIGLSMGHSKIFRVAREFEELRLRIEKLVPAPKVQILLEGDYADLSNRINFIKNYFEVIGLEVLDPLIQVSCENRILVLCAKDENYLRFASKIDRTQARACYVAGKVEVEGFESIFAGQNIFNVLSKLAQKLGA